MEDRIFFAGVASDNGFRYSGGEDSSAAQATAILVPVMICFRKPTVEAKVVFGTLTVTLTGSFSRPGDRELLEVIQLNGKTHQLESLVQRYKRVVIDCTQVSYWRPLGTAKLVLAQRQCFKRWTLFSLKSSRAFQRSVIRAAHGTQLLGNPPIRGRYTSCFSEEATGHVPLATAHSSIVEGSSVAATVNPGYMLPATFEVTTKVASV